jgi:hypothetical protein
MLKMLYQHFKVRYGGVTGTGLVLISMGLSVYYYRSLVDVDVRGGR